MKIKLLNDGGYDFLSNVKFPVLVEGEESCNRYRHLFYVSAAEIKRILPADHLMIDQVGECPTWVFIAKKEAVKFTG